MNDFAKRAAVEWQKKAEESSTLKFKARCKELWSVHGGMSSFRGECARHWMGIDDETDQLYA